MLKKLGLGILLVLLFFGCKSDFLNEQIETILVVPVPEFSIEAGVYNADQIVEILNDLEGVTIYYTLDGSDPTTESAVYSGPIELSGHGTEVVISVMVVREGMQPSEIIRATFTIRYLSVADPVFSHSAGSYPNDIDVSITCASTGASIYYTTDGSIPDETSTPYTGPVFFNSTATLNAIAMLEGIPSSDVTSAQYIIDYNKVATPTFDLTPGTYATDQTLTIATVTSGATIYFTNDGSIPTTGNFAGSGVNSVVVPIAGHGTYMPINAFAVGSGLDDSDITSGTYSIEYPAVEPVTFSLPEGSYSPPQNVVLSTATTTPAPTIYYTTDGSVPTTSSNVYSAPIAMAAGGTYTFRAMATAGGMQDSPVTSAVYDIVPPLTVTEVKKIRGSDVNVNYFAGAVDIAGNYIITGAAHQYGQLGAAYLFERNSGGTNNWGQIKIVTPYDSFSSGQEFFGSWVTVESIGGGSNYYIGVGEHADDERGSWAGAGFVFDKNYFPGAPVPPGPWGQRAKLMGSTTDNDDRNGIGFAFTDSYTFIGANAFNTWQGAVFVFSTSSWTQTNAITALDPTANDGFGYGLDAENNFLIVGSAGHDTLAADAGVIYIYEQNTPTPGAWGLYAKRYASDGAAGDRFGTRVSMSGNYAVVNSYNFTPKHGGAYILDRSGGWNEIAKLSALDVSPGDGFGKSVSISGDYVVVGAPHKDGERGAVYIFDRNHPSANAWGHIATINASDRASGDHFGESVAIDGNTIVVGAYNDDGLGSAYVFTF